MDSLSKCSQLDCMLMGMIVVLVLCLAFKPMSEKFDTSLATRSQVGDATNLDTLNGQGGFNVGNVYDCNTPILMVEPDNAYTWGDSKDYISDASLAHLHPEQIEHLANQAQDPAEQARLRRIALAAHKNSGKVFLAPEHMSTQYEIYNKSADVRNRKLGKEGFAEHLKRTNEGFDTHQSDSSLAAVMRGYSPTSVVPQAVVNRLEKMPFTAEMLRGGAKVEMNPRF